MLTEVLLSSLVLGFCASLVGIVFAYVIPGEGTPLNPYFDWLNAMDSKGRFSRFLAKPLGACEKCFSGQLGFWSSIAFSGWATTPHAWAGHLTSAAMAVVSAYFIAKQWAK